MKNNTSLILDSGAFSAWMKQEDISLDSYAEFALMNLPNIDFVVNLDVIPGKFGMKNINESELERSANEGLDNYKKLIDLGIPKNKLIHVFHQGEKFYHLEEMIKTMDYIGISPANDRTTREKKLWLDKCMNYCADSNGEAIVKFHGFAVTSLPLIDKYPWYSVDSTSWVTTGKYGNILLPRTVRGKLDFSKSPHIICVSDKSPHKNTLNKHFDTLSDIEKSYINRYVEERGFTIEGIKNDGLDRDRINMIFYIELENYLKRVKIYFAGNFPMLAKMEREFKTKKIALSLTDTYRRLCSFYYKTYAERTLLIKKDNVNEKKRIFKRTRKSKTRSRIKRNS